MKQPSRAEVANALMMGSGLLGWVAIFAFLGWIGGGGALAAWAFLAAMLCSGSGIALTPMPKREEPLVLPRPGRRPKVKPLYYAERYYVLASRFDELGEPDMAADHRAWGDLSKLLAEAHANEMFDVDLARGVPQKPAQTVRGPHLIPNTDGGTALGTCSDCGVTIYHEGSHLVKRSGRWRCPNRTEALVRAASKQIFLPRS